ncbi:putative MFS multidrug transporter [Aspergillus floccosus]
MDLKDAPTEGIEEAFVTFEANDPENPRNWPSNRKWASVLTLATMAFVASLASSIFAPGANQAMADFHAPGNSVLSSFTLSVYILGNACGPLLVAPLSETWGRLVPFHVSNVLFVIFTVGCATSPSLPGLIAFRLLAGVAAAAVTNVGAATIGDLFAPQQRGKAMSIWSFGPLLGPAVGPIMGGFVAESLGWRWIFWVVVIAGSLTTALFVLVMRETHVPVLLQRKAARLRKATRNDRLRSEFDDAGAGQTVKRRIGRTLSRPLVLLVRSPAVACFSLLNSALFGYQYFLFTTVPMVFGTTYHFSERQIGLSYLGLAVGLLLGNTTFGQLSDRLMKMMGQSCASDDPLAVTDAAPEHRLPLMIAGACLVPISFFIYGWTVQEQVFWFVPIASMALFGFGVNVCFMTVQVYLVDVYTHYAASALAATTVFRSLVATLLPLAGPSMYRNLGIAWGNSMLAFIALALIPIPIVFLRYGEAIRKNSGYNGLSS